MDDQPDWERWGRFREGREPPGFITDQAEAAAAETWRAGEDLARRGARMREEHEEDAPEVYKALLAEYDRACEEARERYEREVPRAEWVAGRSRWPNCEHLRGGPAPAHWTAAYEPNVLVCDRCWAELPVPVHCGRCGRHDDNLTLISIRDQHTPVTLHAAVCDDCYPAGADAPTPL